MIWRGNRRMPAVLAAAQLTCRRVVTAGRTATRLTTTRHLAHAQRRSMDSTSDPLSEALREAVADTTPVVMPARVRDARRQASMLRASSVGAPTTLQSTAAASSVAAGSATRDSIDQIEEILGGYDEQALSAVVDKTQCMGEGGWSEACAQLRGQTCESANLRITILHSFVC